MLWLLGHDVKAFASCNAFTQVVAIREAERGVVAGMGLRWESAQGRSIDSRSWSDPLPCPCDHAVTTLGEPLLT